MTSVERQCWANNQYTRREFLEITGLPENTDNRNENLPLKVLNKIGVNIDSREVEDYHCTKTQDPKKVVIKLSRRKDANNVRKKKKN